MVGRRGYGRSTSAAPLRALSLRKLSLRKLSLRRLSLCTVALGGAVLCLGSCAYPAGIAPESAPAATAPTVGSAAYPGRASQLPETVPVPAATPAAPPTSEPAAPGATSPGAVGNAGPDAPIPVAEPGTAPPAAPSRPAEAPVRAPGEDPDAAQDHAALYGPAIYLVAIDDGGSRGARFGCNDSLVAVRSDSQGGTGGDAHGSAAGQGDSGQASAGPAANTPSDPLEAAMSRLLGPDSVPAGSGLYNALAASALTFVSGQLEGTTAVVSLSGELRQGGVCDGPRIEAQLTQTAIAATGASRAEIRIGGRPVAELLSLR